MGIASSFVTSDLLPVDKMSRRAMVASESIQIKKENLATITIPMGILTH